MGHALVFVTCCPRWLSAWYAALWFQALCSAEQHPEQPTWQHMERTHLCLPSPSSLQSHGRWSPWHHKHKWELIQAQWNTYSVHVKNQGKWNMNLKVNASVTHFLVLEYTCCTCLAQHHRYQQHAASMMSINDEQPLSACWRLTCPTDQWRGQRCRWRRRRCGTRRKHFLLRPPVDPGWWPAPPSFPSLYEEPLSEEQEVVKQSYPSLPSLHI